MHILPEVRNGHPPKSARVDRGHRGTAEDDAPTTPDLGSVVLVGTLLGEPCTARFVTRAEYDAIPPEARPSALMERSGAWYALFAIDDAPGAIGGGR